MWIVVNIGCIECGVSSNLVGCYDTEKEATGVADTLSNNEAFSWRESGQNAYLVFEARPGFRHPDYLITPPK